MFNRYIFLCIAFLWLIIRCDAQNNCSLSIEGQVIDEATNQPLSYVNVIIQDLTHSTTTDDDGYFKFNNICEGDFHFIFSHIGCEPEEFHVDITQDTSLTIVLSHSSTSLESVTISGKKENLNNQSYLSVNRKTIEDNSNQNLSTLIEKEAGVHLIKNGSGIAKPIVHGLYGNRLTILNNGIVQSGQQWGNDHSPEIDPFSADKITVLKGANAIEFGGGNLGSVILVEPKNVGREPHLHGQLSYAYETNGRGHTLNARIGQYTPFVAWRINGTLKKYGDKKSPDYFLNNTGISEANLSLQLEKSWDEKLFVDLYLSTFNTNLGVLRGSHIGNLTDLSEALDRDVPFFTEEQFSYDLEAPKQDVSHHLAKFQAKYFIDEDEIIEFVVAGQANDRQEFDVRRNDRTEIPALSLQQYTFNTKLMYSSNLGTNWKLKIGNENIFTDNTNNPETGVLPLIPDYSTIRAGLFSTLFGQVNNIAYNIGLRYDYEHQNAATISQSLPREIIRFKNNFHNVGSVIGVKYEVSSTQSISYNIGYASRNPGINELYSAGLHQGVSGIEEGDENLNIEKAIKNTLEYKWLPSTNFSFSSLLYFQHFQNYIFLNPQDEFRLTIRGAFPVFIYKQTDANIMGIDISTQLDITNSIFGLLRYSYIRGQDLSNDVPLVYMPPNSLYGSLTYRSNQAIELFNSIKLDELEFSIDNRLVFKQGRLLENQDFALPPPTYNVIGLKLSTNVFLPEYKFRFFLNVDNLMNTKYRDYLNRQRYFADDTGISIVVGLNFKF